MLCIGNAFFGYAFYVGEQGHWRHTDNIAMVFLLFVFPLISFFAIILMAVFAKSSTKTNRMVFVLYTLFPVVGIVVDYFVHGLSLTYAGLTVSALVIYTSIYIKKKKLIEEQRNALMLSQINPHFIYNTLSTVAAMCDVSPSQAKHLTIDFSRYLRQNLSSVTNENLIPFEEELNHVECYLKIEKTRFRERLNVIYSIGCRDFEVPPLCIQPIVENAVKHGITKKASGGTVRISTYDTYKCYIIDIIDDGVGFDADNTQMHVGIDNVRSRLRSMCKGELSIKSTLGVGTRITLEIPKKKGKRK
jgi:LytS/YehU family sensor histidine kinase